MSPTVSERFWAKVDKTEGCWNWTAGLSKGYGAFNRNQRRISAHRFAWEELRGPIPEGLQIDHLCRNTRCVNPDHLEPVTPAVNTYRGLSPTAENARKTHCIRGHELSGDNVYIQGKGYRSCVACKRLKWPKYREARKLRESGRSAQ